MNHFQFTDLKTKVSNNSKTASKGLSLRTGGIGILIFVFKIWNSDSIDPSAVSPPFFLCLFFLSFLLIELSILMSDADRFALSNFLARFFSSFLDFLVELEDWKFGSVRDNSTSSSD